MRIVIADIYAVDFHPVDKLWMIHDIFLKLITRLVDIIHMGLHVVGIDFTTTFVYRHKHRLYTRRGAGHERSGACRGDGQTRDVAATVFLHILYQRRSGFTQT